MRRRFTITATMATVAVLAAAGCTGGNNDDDESELPDAGELLSQAADEMAGIETVRLQIEADTDLADLPVRGADAVVTQAGDAQGTAQIEQFGQLVEIEFVLVDEAFHYQLLGGWAQIPRADAAELYDPSAILDPDRGLASVLRSAEDPQVQGRQELSGVDTYEVTATFAASDLAAVLPGVPDSVDGRLWIGVERPLLHQADFDVPGGTVTVRLSEFDAPVDISAP